MLELLEALCTSIVSLRDMLVVQSGDGNATTDDTSVSVDLRVSLLGALNITSDKCAPGGLLLLLARLSSLLC